LKAWTRSAIARASPSFAVAAVASSAAWSGKLAIGSGAVTFSNLDVVILQHFRLRLSEMLHLRAPTRLARAKMAQTWRNSGAGF
jgi:hypothetical protein